MQCTSWSRTDTHTSRHVCRHMWTYLCCPHIPSQYCKIWPPSPASSEAQPSPEQPAQPASAQPEPISYTHTHRGRGEHQQGEGEAPTHTHNVGGGAHAHPRRGGWGDDLPYQGVCMCVHVCVCVCGTHKSGTYIGLSRPVKIRRDLCFVTCLQIYMHIGRQFGEGSISSKVFKTHDKSFLQRCGGSYGGHLPWPSQYGDLPSRKTGVPLNSMSEGAN